MRSRSQGSVAGTNRAFASTTHVTPLLLAALQLFGQVHDFFHRLVKAPIRRRKTPLKYRQFRGWERTIREKKIVEGKSAPQHGLMELFEHNH